MTYYITDGETVSIMSDGKEIGRLPTSGCYYNDLDSCQGCPVCSLHPEDEDDEDEHTLAELCTAEYLK